MVETIRSLVQQDGETGVEVFNRLMNGLEGQLNGMGVAFASSLLGLAGSLVVGLLELAGMVNLAKTNPKWLGMAMEGYVSVSYTHLTLPTSDLV